MRLRIEAVALGLAVLAVVAGGLAALQAPTQVVLANGGRPSTALVLTGILTVPGSVIYGWWVLRGRAPSTDRRPAGGDLNRTGTRGTP